MLATKPTPEIIAHRGLTGSYAPRGEQVGEENTLTAFRHALLLGVDGIELDVHRTKDGILVVIHDKDLNRTTTGNGLVSDYTYDELKDFNIKRADGTILNDKIPLLSDVLNLLAEAKRNNQPVPKLNIELKTNGIEKELLELVGEYRLENDEVWYSSFIHETLRKIRDLDKNSLTALLYHSDDRPPSFNRKSSISDAKDIHAKAIHLDVRSLLLPQSQVDKNLIQMLQDNNLTVRCYTVNDPQIAKPLLTLGVGVITNVPDVMTELKRNIKNENPNVPSLSLDEPTE
jgi:glycerophosphoryl diester phosphodiesterase